MSEVAQTEDNPGGRSTLGTIVRLIVYTLGGLVLLVACLAISFFVFPPGWLARDLIIRAVQQQTGRTLTVAGESKLSLWPKIRLRIGKLSLSGRAAAKDLSPLTADGVEIKLKVVDLWKGKFEVPEVVLVRPVVRLTAGDPLLARVAEGEVSVGGIPQIVTITDGSIMLVAAQPQETMKFEKVTGRIIRIKEGQGVTFKGSLATYGKTNALEGELSDLFALAAGRGSPITVSVKSDLFQASVSGHIATKPIGQFTGKVEAKTGQLPKLLKWINVDAGQAGLGQTAALKGQISGSLRRLSLNPVTITLQPIRGVLVGDLSIDKERPNIKASLTTDVLDINALLPKAARPTAFALSTLERQNTLPTAWQSLLEDLDGAPAKHRGVRLAAIVPNAWWSTRPFTLTKLPNMDVELNIKASKINYGQLPLKNGELVVHSSPKGLKVLLKKIGLYEGTVSGLGELSLAEGPLSTGLRLKFKRLKIEPFVAEMLTQRLLKGVGDLEIAVAGRGGTMRELIGSLDGSAMMRVNKGEIIGFDLRRAVLNFGIGQGYNPARRTKFKTLKGSFSVRGGVLRSTESLNLNGPEIDLTAEGSLGLVSGRLDQRLRLNLKPPPLHLPIPLRMRGTVEKPSIKWDIFSAIAEPTKFATPFAVGSESEKMPDAVRNAIEKALAKDTSKSQISAGARRFLETLLSTR